ncbi:hypothetical protein [Anaerotignum sp. MB30-C6]|uniref:hypothetical protein n=1 Tax=Anaerotignum sp. MB30-C6 TaxID=3070814 RepID=UPI0027DCC406|nr:hypothetical protein [Anaerotignum sp. MB30-C6]WMI82454.1 hypothetical protein RBQ60_06890 [Anaerotignum sp. MB30-C6]
MSAFKGVAIKTLSSVEINHWQSNQHEFHGVSALKSIFGYSRQYFNGEFYYVESGGRILKDFGELTWYDAREYSPDRTEYRFYYSENVAVNNAKVGDTLVVALCENNVVKIIIVEQGTKFIDVLKASMGLSSIADKYQVVNNLSLLSDLANALK